ncbi:hypothetical protein [Algicella marina]|uniref:Uncharacterized protein n=1 Tax=Algicella marina TaxID=2683284 RepID=A0A6P1T2V3_9RHOB|nr:hypothetical protein [Algicella marina]QHQ34832.1 hypothetical protein GO499_06275 [Algicella marina]
MTGAVWAAMTVTLGLLLPGSGWAESFCPHDDEYDTIYGFLPGLGEGDPDRVFSMDINCKTKTLRTEAGKAGFSGDAPFEFSFPSDGGRSWQVRLDLMKIGHLRLTQAEVDLLEGDRVVAEGTFDGTMFYDARYPQCRFGNGESTMVSGGVYVRYDKKDATRLVGLVTERRWQNGWGDYVEGPEGLLNCNSDCGALLDVGPGMELAAVQEINALGGSICAGWDAVGAGTGPMLVGEFPLGTFLDPANPDSRALAQRLDRMLRQQVFADTVRMSGLRIEGPGHIFALSVLGYGPDMGITLGKGFWYQADITLSIGLQMGFNANLFETITITLNDVVEIRGPESMDEIPEGLIRSGSVMRMYEDGATAISWGDASRDLINSGPFGPALTEDGSRMLDWQRLLATRIAQAAGAE